MTEPKASVSKCSNWFPKLNAFFGTKISPKFMWMLLGALITFFLCFKSIFSGPFDLGYDLIAVSWGSKRGSDQLYYQAQVYIDNAGQPPPLEIKARVCIGSGSYQHSLGTIGWADSRTEAIQKYGTIQWTETDVLFGKTNEVRIKLSRQSLEQHR